MRKILFRGKQKDNGEWTYGYYGEFHNRPIVNEPNSCQIFEPTENAVGLYGSMIGGIWHIVDRETVGQYTGLTDKNGKQIFEGDIVKINGWWNAAGWAGYTENLTVVEFNESLCGFTPMCIYDCDCGVYHEARDTEVIGNIYDNPELLGGAK